MAKRQAKSSGRRRTYTISLAHRKARGSGYERLSEIMAAARQLFVERGLENVTTREIAARVGISQTALFTYYKTKDEILDRLMVDAFSEFSRSLASVGQDSPTVAEWLRSAIRAYVRFGLAYPDEYRLAFMLIKTPKQANGSSPGEESGAVQRIAFPIFLKVEERIATAMRDGFIRRDLGSATLIAQTLWASMHGLTSLLIARPRPHFPWEDHDRLIAAQTEILINGILADAKKSG